MKIKDEFVLTGFADKYVALSTEDSSDESKALVSLNKSGAFTWELLQREIFYEEVIAALSEKYDAPEDELRSDFDEFLNVLREHSLLEE